MWPWFDERNLFLRGNLFKSNLFRLSWTPKCPDWVFWWPHWAPRLCHLALKWALWLSKWPLWLMLGDHLNLQSDLLDSPNYLSGSSSDHLVLPIDLLWSKRNIIGPLGAFTVLPSNLLAHPGDFIESPKNFVNLASLHWVWKRPLLQIWLLCIVCSSSE